MALNITELEKVIDQLGKDKGIDKQLLVSAIEEALLAVARKKYGPLRDIEARYNDELGEVELFQFMNVVEKVTDREKEISVSEARTYDENVAAGDSLGIKLDTSHISRIAAQTAKQVIVQKVRDAEREIIFNEFQHRKGEVIMGLVRRVDRGAVIVDLGRTEGYMPIKEQIPDEPYNPGDRIQAYLADVQLTPKGPRIILSRACPEYLMSLFTNEVPEIREGLIEIKGAARDPGIRAKVAVSSKDSDIDPVGACVGVRGSRVQNIVQELRGERIDIVPWDEDISRFVCNALAPAEIQKVIIDDENRSMEVVVGDDNLSLAIGKRGQNVRLASQLTKWKLDIVSENDMAARLAEAKWRLMQIPEVSETQAIALFQSGIGNAYDAVSAETSLLKDVPGFDETSAANLVKNAQTVIDQGAADQAVPESITSAFKKRVKGAKNDSSDGGASKEMSSMEEKLRAELAAREKGKSEEQK
jgi:N utilization substance protein A